MSGKFEAEGRGEGDHGVGSVPVPFVLVRSFYAAQLPSV